MEIKIKVLKVLKSAKPWRKCLKYTVCSDNTCKESHLNRVFVRTVKNTLTQKLEMK